MYYPIRYTWPGIPSLKYIRRYEPELTGEIFSPDDGRYSLLSGKRLQYQGRAGGKVQTQHIPFPAL